MINQRDVEAEISGADAVIEGVTSYTEGTKTIITALQNLGIKRRIAVSTYSAPDPNDGFHLGFKAAMYLLSIIVADPVKNIRHAAQFIRASDLDWILVLVLGLNNKPPINHITYGYPGKQKLRLFNNSRRHGPGNSRSAYRYYVLRRAPAISN